MEIIEVSEEFKKDKVKFPIEVACEYCRSKLLLEKEDLECAEFGAMWYRCPVCKRRNMIDEVEGITLTADNINFPNNFWHYNDGVDLSSDDIKKYIKDGIIYFRNNPEVFTYCTGSGNTHVMVQNYSGDKDYYVVVTKDYYDMEIPYEDIDYAIQDENSWNWKNIGVNMKRQKVKDG